MLSRRCVGDATTLGLSGPRRHWEMAEAGFTAGSVLMAPWEQPWCQIPMLLPMRMAPGQGAGVGCIPCVAAPLLSYDTSSRTGGHCGSDEPKRHQTSKTGWPSWTRCRLSLIVCHGPWSWFGRS